MAQAYSCVAPARVSDGYRPQLGPEAPKALQCVGLGVLCALWADRGADCHAGLIDVRQRHAERNAFWFANWPGAAQAQHWQSACRLADLSCRLGDGLEQQ